MHCKSQQSPSEVSEQLQRFFSKLVEWFPEPTHEEMDRVFNSPTRSHAR